MTERQVVLGEVAPKDAVTYLKGADGFNAGSIAQAVPSFTASNRYCFKAEWAMIGDDIQVQFFMPAHARLTSPEERQAWMKYWLDKFPGKLDLVAQEYFEAKYPRLVAKWTEEVGSWWFRASSYAYLLDVGRFLEGFFDRLEAELQQKESSK